MYKVVLDDFIVVSFFVNLIFDIINEWLKDFYIVDIGVEGFFCGIYG